MAHSGCLMKIDYEPKPVVRGYTDTYLHIDLSALKVEARPVAPEMKESFIGGRGYCLKLVFDGTNAETRYDSPENVLALAGGPLCGEVKFPGSGKFIAGTISPLTGTFLDSNAGGMFFPLAKLCGFDAIAITGRASQDVLVMIDGDAKQISIIEAQPDDLGGLQAPARWIEDFAHGAKQANVAAVAAGIGGENCAWGIISSVYYDVARKRVRAKQFGRGGTGTVMRAKGLRGIIAKNNAAKDNAPADCQRVKEAGSGLRRVITKADPVGLQMRRLGTPGLVEMLNEFHLLPVHNFQFGQHPEAYRVYGEEFEKAFFTQKVPDGCYYGCNLACTKGGEEFKLATGPYKGQKVGIDGPEYETIAAATNVGIFDIPFVLEYNWYCDEYGIDTISLGNGMGFAFETFQRGFITEEDTGGLELTWGNREAAFALLHQVAHGEGFGAVLGRGVVALKNWIADRFAGRDGGDREKGLALLNKFALVCKGLEFSFYLTKESLAQQGGYGYALKGPQHDEAWLISLDQVKNEIPTFAQKAEALRWFPLIRSWFNIVGLCKLPWIDVRHPDAAKEDEPAKNLPSLRLILDHYNASLGTNKTFDDVLYESERVYTFHKLFNLRQGFGTREHDRVPYRSMGPVFENEYESRRDHYDEYLRSTVGVDPTGLSASEKLRHVHDYRQEQYDKMTDVVYEEKGYDHNGVPTLETLKRFNLDTPDLIAIIESRSTPKPSGLSAGHAAAT